MAFDFGGKFGIGIGSLVMLVNILLLTTYSSRAIRCAPGGRKTGLLLLRHAGVASQSAWRGVTKLNEHHMFWAWVSMISVGLTDLYIRLVASGALKDIRIL